MNGDLLLDTSVVIAYLRNNEAIRSRLAGMTAFVPAVVVGELYFGILKSTRRDKNLEQVERFIAVNTVSSCRK